MPLDSTDIFDLLDATLGRRNGLALMFEIYMDESGVHENSPFLTVGAYAQRPKVWRKWTKQWDFQKFPIKVFHATDCHNRKNEWDGWSPECRDEWVKALLPVIPRHALAGVVVGIDMNAFNATMKKHPDLLKIFTTPYGACFHWVLATFLDVLVQHKNHTPIAVFHEHNDYEKEALEGFNWIKANADPNRNLTSITFADKSLTPLQAADVLAFEGYRVMQRPNVTRPAYEVLRGGVMALEYGADNMHKLVLALSDIRDGKLGINGQFMTDADRVRIFGKQPF